MSPYDFVKEGFNAAVGSLRRRTLRTFLSSLGVIVGTFCMIGIFTAIDSLQIQIKQNILVFTNARQVFVDKWGFNFSDDYPWWRYVARPYPTRVEYQFLRDRTQHAEAMCMYSIRSGVPIQRGSDVFYSFRLFGVSLSYPDVNEFPIAEGRFFSPREAEQGQAVLILGAALADALFPRESAVGHRVRIKGKQYLVIGVLKRYGAGVGFSTIDENVYLPHRAFAGLYRVGKKGTFSRIVALAYENDKNMEKLTGELTGLMRARRGLSIRADDDFSINKVETFFAFLDAFFATVKTIGFIIGSFSIVIGAFNIANIMFVSVKERTPEIGLQKALGAQKRFILFQFILEATLLSVLGGTIGLLLVYLVSLIQLPGFDIVLTRQNIFIGLSISVITGVAAGWIPAARAAKLDPIKALQST